MWHMLRFFLTTFSIAPIFQPQIRETRGLAFGLGPPSRAATSHAANRVTSRQFGAGHSRRRSQPAGLRGRCSTRQQASPEERLAALFAFVSNPAANLPESPTLSNEALAPSESF